MRQTKQIVLTIILTLALVSLSWLAGQTRSRVQLVPVVVARHAVEAGAVLNEQALLIRYMPQEFVQADWIGRIETAAGLRARVPLAAGEILQQHKLTSGMSGLQYPYAGTGRRLMTIRLDAAAANGFWLAEGNRVDIHLVPRTGTAGTSHILESIRILSVLDDTAAGGFAASGTALLLCLDLSREEAMQLAAAENAYFFKLAVVNEPEESDR